MRQGRNARVAAQAPAALRELIGVMGRIGQPALAARDMADRLLMEGPAILASRGYRPFRRWGHERDMARIGLVAERLAIERVLDLVEKVSASAGPVRPSANLAAVKRLCEALIVDVDQQLERAGP